MKSYFQFLDPKTSLEEKDLYFVVSGNLKETVFAPLRKGEDSLYRKRAFFLTENQIFGEIYPFKEENRSKSYIETSTRTELIRITKSRVEAILMESRTAAAATVSPHPPAPKR